MIHRSVDLFRTYTERNLNGAREFPWVPLTMGKVLLVWLGLCRLFARNCEVAVLEVDVDVLPASAPGNQISRRWYYPVWVARLSRDIY